MPRKKRGRSSSHTELPFAKFKPNVKDENDGQNPISKANSWGNNGIPFGNTAEQVAKNKSEALPNASKVETDTSPAKRSFFNAVMRNMGGFGDSAQKNPRCSAINKTKSDPEPTVGDLF